MEQITFSSSGSNFITVYTRCDEILELKNEEYFFFLILTCFSKTCHNFVADAGHLTEKSLLKWMARGYNNDYNYSFLVLEGITHTQLYLNRVCSGSRPFLFVYETRARVEKVEKRGKKKKKKKRKEIVVATENN